jgi:hypothetical protein
LTIAAPDRNNVLIVCPSDESSRPPCPTLANRALSLACLAVLLVYGIGLTRNFAAPWTGLHDWNGAFFSELARNLLRYPWEIHHGMPIVGVGEQVPPPAERSIYATHPPGLVWLVAVSFSLLGESEWAARLVPIVASLASLLLLVSLVKRRYGSEVAVLAGLVYALLPMAVFYGRMVDHEAVCLAGMLAAMKCRQLCRVRYANLASKRSEAGGVGPHRGPCEPSQRLTLVGLAAALVFIIWIDWSGLLFAALFCGYAVVHWSRGGMPGRVVLVSCAATLVSTAAMLVYLVYAGLGGVWGNLIALFTSRAGRVEEINPARIWENATANFTWAILTLAFIGLAIAARSAVHHRPRSRFGLDQLERNHAYQPEALAREYESKDEAETPARPTSSMFPSDDHGVAPCIDSSCTPSALPVLAVTGLIWIVLFPRQYQIHSYWAFYLGPVAAVLAGLALRAVRESVEALNRWLGRLVAGAACLIVSLASISGADDFFRVGLYAHAVESYRAIHSLTRSDDRLVLFEDPIRPEQHGTYQFRNITPPHLAYYLDRAFDVDQDFGRIAARTSRYAGLVIPLWAAEAHRVELQQFFGSRQAIQVGPELFVSLDPGM